MADLLIEELNKQTNKQMNEWEKLKKLTGYVQNGSDVTVKLFQDDVTRTYWIKVGSKSHYGSSFDESLSKFEVDDEDI